jgi:hypothetical protein
MFGYMTSIGVVVLLVVSGLFAYNGQMLEALFSWGLAASQYGQYRRTRKDIPEDVLHETAGVIKKLHKKSKKVMG